MRAAAERGACPRLNRRALLWRASSCSRHGNAFPITGVDQGTDDLHFVVSISAVARRRFAYVASRAVAGARHDADPISERRGKHADRDERGTEQQVGKTVHAGSFQALLSARHAPTVRAQIPVIAEATVTSRSRRASDKRSYLLN